MNKQLNDGKLRFGILDAVVVIIVIALAVALVFRFTTDMRLFAYDTEKYIVTVRAEGLQYTTANMISASDSVYFESGDYFGKFVSSPTVTPKMMYELGTEGDLIPAYYPDNTLIDFTNSIECEAVSNDGVLMTRNGVHLAVGVVFELHTRTVNMNVEIIGIEKIQP